MYVEKHKTQNNMRTKKAEMNMLILECSLSSLSLSVHAKKREEKKKEVGNREREREDVNLWCLMEKSTEGCSG